jgi:hypothetical protein
MSHITITTSNTFNTFKVQIVRYESQDPITETEFSFASETLAVEAQSPKHAVMEVIKKTSLEIMGAHVHYFVDGKRIHFG